MQLLRTCPPLARLSLGSTLLFGILTLTPGQAQTIIALECAKSAVSTPAGELSLAYRQQRPAAIQLVASGRSEDQASAIRPLASDLSLRAAGTISLSADPMGKKPLTDVFSLPDYSGNQTIARVVAQVLESIFDSEVAPAWNPVALAPLPLLRNNW